MEWAMCMLQRSADFFNICDIHQNICIYYIVSSYMKIICGNANVKHFKSLQFYLSSCNWILTVLSINEPEQRVGETG